MNDVKPQIVVAGTGKMARDVGVFFLGHGHPVAWLSRDEGRLASLEGWVRKRIRRLAAFKEEIEGAQVSFGEPSFFIVGSTSLPRAEVFLECINEDEEDKKALLEALSGVIPDDAITVTNSSSIFPDALHRECAGLHFFYPVEMTGFVEAVFPKGFPEERRRRLLSLLADTRLECIEEEAESAFAVNRLLLPVQAEALRLLIDGWDPRVVEEASRSSVLPLGQLSLMDSIGLDVVYPAVCNFMGRMDEIVARQYVPLRDGLHHLLELGKQGKKNRDGLLRGKPLPWRNSEGARRPSEEVAARFRCLFVNTCFYALEAQLLAPDKLRLALSALFGWDKELEEALAPLSKSEAYEILVKAYETEGCLYFVPAMTLRDEATLRGWPDHGPLI